MERSNESLLQRLTTRDYPEKDLLLLLFVEIVKQKGLENITVDELVQEITPKGRGRPIPCRSLSLFAVRSVGSRLDQEGNVGSTSSISLETRGTLNTAENDDDDDDHLFSFFCKFHCPPIHWAHLERLKLCSIEGTLEILSDMTSNPRDETDVLSNQLATAGRSRGGPHGFG